MDASCLRLTRKSDKVYGKMEKVKNYSRRNRSCRILCTSETSNSFPIPGHIHGDDLFEIPIIVDDIAQFLESLQKNFRRSLWRERKKIEIDAFAMSEVECDSGSPSEEMRRGKIFEERNEFSLFRA